MTPVGSCYLTKQQQNKFRFSVFIAFKSLHTLVSGEFSKNFTDFSHVRVSWVRSFVRSFARFCEEICDRRFM